MGKKLEPVCLQAELPWHATEPRLDLIAIAARLTDEYLMAHEAAFKLA
jgi:hypothetical protein